MIASASRQDVQNIVDKSRGIIVGNMLSRSDLQTVVNQIRMGLVQDLHVLHAENQAVMNQAANGRGQLMQRMSAVEASLARIEQNLRRMPAQDSKTSNTLCKMQPDSGYLFRSV